MNRTSGFPARPHLWIPACIALAALLQAGCASQAAQGRGTGVESGDRESAGKLYEGQPAVVHATEYPVMSAAEGIARGDAAWRRGELDLAIYLYVQSLAYDSGNPAPLLKIGAIHEHRGNRALAEKAFEQALKLGADNAGANERLGLLYLQDGRDDAARALFERAISLEPSRWQSHNGLGIAADRREDFAAAIRHYDAALALEPRAAMVVNNRGYSRYLAGDLRGAEADFRTALELGARAGTWTNLGKAQAGQRHYAEALESLMKEHDAAHAHNILGEVALDGGDLGMAQNEFALALSESPRYFQAAQDNLDLVNKRIAEQAMGGDTEPDNAAKVTSGTPPVAATIPTATLAATSTNRAYSQVLYRSAGRGSKAKNASSWTAASASCAGAAASKPRCTGGAKKRPKPYQVASARRPRT